MFVNRLESQLAGADSFEIRNIVDTSYERLANVMFDTLRQLAKMDGEGEEKGQQNIILIGRTTSSSKGSCADTFGN